MMKLRIWSSKRKSHGTNMIRKDQNENALCATSTDLQYFTYLHLTGLYFVPTDILFQLQPEFLFGKIHLPSDI